MPDTTINPGDITFGPELMYDPATGGYVPAPQTIQGLPAEVLLPAPASIPRTLGDAAVLLVQGLTAIPNAVASAAQTGTANITSGMATGIKWAIVLGVGYLIFKDALTHAPETAAAFAASAQRAKRKKPSALS